MKAQKVLQRYQYPFYALCLAPQAWSSLHGKIVLYEAVLYCLAFVSSLFLSVLTLGGWGGLGGPKNLPAANPPGNAPWDETRGAS